MSYFTDGWTDGVTTAIACQLHPPLSTSIPLCSVDREEAVAWGPNHDSPPLCLSCLSPVTGEFVCPDCGLPLCDEICARGEHSRWECRIFRERKLVVNITDFTGSYSPFYQSITALRSDNILYTITILSLCLPQVSHAQERRPCQVEFTEGKSSQFTLPSSPRPVASV